MRRFFLGKNRIENGRGSIEGDLFRHLVTVLRLEVGAQLILAEDSGAEYHAVITEILPDRAIVSASPLKTEDTSPLLSITLFQGLPKGDKMELILQKGTELGVSAFVPFIAERSVSRPQGNKLHDKRSRWEKITAEAARQCKARTIPQVADIADLKTAVTTSSQALKLLLWEEENHRQLRDVIRAADAPSDIAIMIGPEGGLTAAEAQTAMAAGFIPVTLGERILRTETAGLAAVAILQYQWGDLG